MTRIQHPRALEGDPPGVAIDVDGEHVAPDEEGVYELPEDAEGWLERFAAANDADAEELVVEADSGTCQVVKNDGEVCGRDLPCSYHSDEDTADADAEE